ncbi:MAG: phosphoribosyltransferase family protein [Cyanobium sp.]
MSVQPPLWADRHQAGLVLAEALGDRRDHAEDTLLLALPRGGVAVAAAMAAQLRLPLATWSVRKIADPAWPELAIGAVAAHGVVVWRNGDAARRRAQAAQRQGWLAAQQQELERRRRLFGDPEDEQLRHRHLIVVDDGIATGMTVKAALLSLQTLAPASLCLAVPVVERSVAGELEALVDQLVALALVDDLRAVGLWYRQFEQLHDEEVLELLRQQTFAMEARASRSRSEGLR